MVTHEDIQVQLEAGRDRFSKVEALLSEVVAGQKRLGEKFEPIANDITEIKDMVGAWKAIAAAGKFAKWMGGIASGLVAAWVIFKVAAKAAMGG